MTKILVIEDDIALKDNIIDILKEESFQAMDAANGLVGLKLAQEYLPDLILCDVRMPDLNGYEILKILKQDRLTSWIPFIFLTSKTNRASWRKGMEMGADDYITKPFTPQELLKAIAVRHSRSVANCKSHKNLPNDTSRAEEILNFDCTTNLASRLRLQDKFEELVKNCLLEKVKAGKNGKIRLNIPIIYIKIEYFTRLSEFSSESQLRSLLKTIAESLEIAIISRKIVTYLEGGTFVMILPSLSRRKDVIPLVNKIQQILTSALDRQMNVENSLSSDRNCLSRLNFPIDSHIYWGVSFYPDFGTSLPVVIKQARDVSSARYCNSRNYALYRPQRRHCFDHVIDRVIKRELKNALALKEFQIYYQPLIELGTGKICGGKATLAWQHPIHGYIAPQRFIPIAEETGDIVPLSRWLLDRACQQSNIWQQHSYKKIQLVMRIFQSHFERDTFNLDISRTIQKYQLDYDSLQLLITEHISRQNRQQAISKLNGLSNLGVKIVLDNFATGYTNLDYWQEFPLDGIRLNWQHIQSIYSGDRARQIVEAATTLANVRDLVTTVEGVETEADWQFIAQQQCDFASGFYFTHPLVATEFSQFLRDRQKMYRNSAGKN